MTTERRGSRAPVRASSQQQEQRSDTPAALQAAAQAHALAALNTLAWLVEHAVSEAVRVSAANAVLDRAHGRPLSGAKGGSDEEVGAVARLEVQWLDPAKS